MGSINEDLCLEQAFTTILIFNGDLGIKILFTGVNGIDHVLVLIFQKGASQLPCPGKFGFIRVQFLGG